MHADADDVGEDAAVASSLAGYTGHLLRRVYVRANVIARSVMPAGSHPRDFAILAALADRDAYSQQGLAEKLRVNRSIMVKVIDKLEAAGYVERRRNPDDRRSYTLAVTSDGRRAMARMAPAVRRGDVRLTEALRSDERKRLIALLRKLVPELEHSRPNPSDEGSAGWLVGAYYWLRPRGDQALAASGLQMRHFGALATLDEVQPCTQQQLARRVGLTEPAMVQVIDALQGEGLVERRRSPEDRRRHALHVTDLGRTWLRQARQALDAIEADVVAILGEADHQELHRLLRKLLRTARQ